MWTKLQPTTYFIALATLIAILFIVALVYSFLYFSRRALAYEGEIKQVKDHTAEAVLKANIQGKEQERKRIGGDIHDDIGPMLAVAKMSLYDFSRCEDEAAIRAHIQKVEAELNEVAGKIRDLSKELVPEVLIQEGLEGAIRQVCRKINQRGVVYAQFSLKGTLPSLNIMQQLTILRMVQELSNNVGKYAEAENLSILLHRKDKQFILEVADDGKGIDLQLVDSGKQKGFGLKNIALRAKELDGKFEIYPVQPHGTRAVVTMFERA